MRQEAAYQHETVLAVLEGHWRHRKSFDGDGSTENECLELCEMEFSRFLLKQFLRFNSSSGSRRRPEPVHGFIVWWAELVVWVAIFRNASWSGRSVESTDRRYLCVCIRQY